MPDHSHCHDQDDQGNGKNDQVVSDLNDRFLEMACGSGLFNQFGRSTEVGIHTCRSDHPVHLPLPDHGTRICQVPRAFFHRQGLSRQSRFINIKEFS